MTRKRAIIVPLLLAMGLLLGACGQTAQHNQAAAGGSGSSAAANSEAAQAATGQAEAAQPGEGADTRIYESENGPIQVPAHPQRVVVLTRFLTGHVMALGVPLVGVDEMSKTNPRFAEQLKDVEAVSDESLEKILELQPDLIISLDGIQNVDKLQQIAPTVTYTYGKVDYLTQQIEVGKLLGKEKEAQAWVDDFRARATQAGEEIRAKIGDDATVSVIETFNKQLYVYGYNFSRGTEILYGEMKLKMPKTVEEATKADGYLALSTEVLPEYFGDYVIFSKNMDEDSSFQDTSIYKGIPAVQNKHVYEVDAKQFYFNDPLTLEFQLEFIKNSLLSE